MDLGQNLPLNKAGLYLLKDEKLTDGSIEFLQLWRHVSAPLSSCNRGVQALTCLHIVLAAAERPSLFLSAGVNQPVGILLTHQCKQLASRTIQDGKQAFDHHHQWKSSHSSRVSTDVSVRFTLWHRFPSNSGVLSLNWLSFSVVQWPNIL